MVHGGRGKGAHHAVEEDADGCRQRNGCPAPAEGRLQRSEQHAGRGAQPGREQQAEKDDADHHECVALAQAGNGVGMGGMCGRRHAMLLIGTFGTDDNTYWSVTSSSRIMKMTRSEEHTSELQSRENLVCR